VVMPQILTFVIAPLPHERLPIATLIINRSSLLANCYTAG
jgi:hypothetical protein